MKNLKLFFFLFMLPFAFSACSDDEEAAPSTNWAALATGSYSGTINDGSGATSYSFSIARISDKKLRFTDSNGTLFNIDITTNSGNIYYMLVNEQTNSGTTFFSKIKSYEGKQVGGGYNSGTGKLTLFINQNTTAFGLESFDIIGTK